MKMIKKLLTIIVYYSVFFSVSYGLFLLISRFYFIKNLTMSSGFFVFYLFIIIPTISFFTCSKYLIKKYNFNKIFVYTFNFIIVYAAAIFFSALALTTFSFGGF